MQCASIIILFITLSISLSSQKVGLVLSGGAASGIAHIGVIKALEEKGIQVDRRSITIDTDVKVLGEYSATIHLVGELKPQLKFWVVKAE